MDWADIVFFGIIGSLFLLLLFALGLTAWGIITQARGIRLVKSLRADEPSREELSKRVSESLARQAESLELQREALELLRQSVDLLRRLVELLESKV